MLAVTNLWSETLSVYLQHSGVSSHAIDANNDAHQGSSHILPNAIVCMDKCIDMCIDMGTDVRVDMCKGPCIDMRRSFLATGHHLYPPQIDMPSARAV